MHIVIATRFSTFTIRTQIRLFSTFLVPVSSATLTLPIAREFETWGIRCVSIAPGYMRTAIFDNMSQEVIDGFDSDLVFPHRFGKPYEEFAFLFEHIVENTYINGCTLRIDAAQRM